ncbi:MAG: hypothetical protein ACI9QL_005203, partial [Candidatus Omnitrophota bacterium]
RSSSLGLRPDKCACGNQIELPARPMSAWISKSVCWD